MNNLIILFAEADANDASTVNKTVLSMTKRSLEGCAGQDTVILFDADVVNTQIFDIGGTDYEIGTGDCLTDNGVRTVVNNVMSTDFNDTVAANKKPLPVQGRGSRYLLNL